MKMSVNFCVYCLLVSIPSICIYGSFFLLAVKLFESPKSLYKLPIIIHIGMGLLDKDSECVQCSWEFFCWTQTECVGCNGEWCYWTLTECTV